MDQDPFDKLNQTLNIQDLGTLFYTKFINLEHQRIQTSQTSQIKCKCIDCGFKKLSMPKSKL